MVYRDTKETEGRMNVEDKRRSDERFVEAIRQNRAGMFRVARMMLRSDSDAEETVADATESAYAHLRALRNWEAVRPMADAYYRQRMPQDAQTAKTRNAERRRDAV